VTPPTALPSASPAPSPLLAFSALPSLCSFCPTLRPGLLCGWEPLQGQGSFPAPPVRLSGPECPSSGDDRTHEDPPTVTTFWASQIQALQFSITERKLRLREVRVFKSSMVTPPLMLNLRLSWVPQAPTCPSTRGHAQDTQQTHGPGLLAMDPRQRGQEDSKTEQQMPNKG
jgi:hypothetical protein